MKANELRVNNIVSLFGEEIQITSENIEDFESYEPIPLTEKWLTYFDFEKDDYENYFIDLNFDTILQITVTDRFYPSIEQQGEFAHMEDNYVFLKALDYVHELQNLFYIISKQEL